MSAHRQECYPRACRKVPFTGTISQLQNCCLCNGFFQYLQGLVVDWRRLFPVSAIIFVFVTVLHEHGHRLFLPASIVSSLKLPQFLRYLCAIWNIPSRAIHKHQRLLMVQFPSFDSTVSASGLCRSVIGCVVGQHHDCGAVRSN